MAPRKILKTASDNLTEIPAIRYETTRDDGDAVNDLLHSVEEALHRQGTTLLQESQLAMKGAATESGHHRR